MKNVKKLVLVLSVFGLLCVATLAQAAPKSELDVFWQAENPKSTVVVNHQPWQTLLTRYVVTNHPSGVYRFDYAKVGPADKQALNDYLQDLQSLDPRELNRTEQKAYWINLYNGLTVKLILDNYPIASIRKLGGLFSFGPWDDKLATIQGKQLSLNDIEHHILRPIWQDNRIHYAVNCASVGCPNLAAFAYTAKTTEAMLDQAAKQYVNHPRGVSIIDGELTVSSIYVWYKVDFGNTDRLVIAHLIKYAEPGLKLQLQSYKGEMDDQYDWALNQP